MRNGMIDHAKTLDGVSLQVEDATDDVAKQLGSGPIKQDSIEL